MVAKLQNTEKHELEKTLHRQAHRPDPERVKPSDRSTSASSWWTAPNVDPSGCSATSTAKCSSNPPTVEHTNGGLRAMTQLVADACRAEGLTDTIVAVEMTGIYHKPVQRAFRKAKFDTRIVHPFASNHYRRPLHPDEKTDDNDLEAIFHATVNGYGSGHAAGRRSVSIAASCLAASAQPGQATCPTDGTDASAAASNDAGLCRSV